ncbi:amino acid adenylation domain-containing protein [Gordonia liuliyuniae]|uniref:Amino acid adenylation domain-containing protein n=1 Tax=Gordonia liuliyuniae TaxID=2911517 RepID=A0ABS9ITZ8_9ACTN|nr:amino acid adenylation domain-containing protein [Gordonia liuliyuniae]MCF8589039.1 amino acid adenylation domain-containing protein [Gordonia liuliyuniae]
MTRIPLNRAQRAIWTAQHLLGDDTPIAIAQCLEIRGALDPDLLVTVVGEVSEALGVSTTRVYVDGAEPYLSIEGGSGVATERVCVRDADDPDTAAAEAMAQMSTAPLPPDGPLIRYALIEVGPRKWIFYARAHHLLIDGYGSGLVMRHVAHRYRRALGHQVDDAKLPEPQPITVIVEQERAYRDSARRLRDREHWRAVMAAAPEPLRTGEDISPISNRTHLAGADLSSMTIQRLGATAARAAVPTAAVLVAAAGVCLSRITDRSAIPFTLVTSTRTSAAVRATAGTLSNLLPVIVEHRSELPVDPHLRTVGRLLSDALRHQQYRYEDMVVDRGGIGSEVAGLVRLGPVLNLVPSPPGISLGDGMTCDLRVLTTGPVSDLNINVYPGGADRLRVEIEVNADVHQPAFADVILAGVLDAVAALCDAAGDDPIDSLSPEAPSWTPCTPSAGASGTLADGYLRARDSTRVAVVDEEGGSHSYRETADAAAGLAAELSSRAEPGDVVAVICERSLRSVVAAWAVASAGMCVLPIDPSLPEPRRRTMLAAGSPAVVVGRGSGFDIDLDAVSAVSGPTRVRRACACSPAYLLFTSGSTGTPKGIWVSHSGVADLTAEIAASYEVTSASVVAHLASPGFDTAIVEMLAAAHAGASLTVVPAHIRGGVELAQCLRARGVTHLLVTPAVLATLPEDGMPDLTHLIVGGDTCPAPLMHRWARRATIRCAYGPTETTCSVMLTDPVTPGGTESRIPLGRPMSGVRLQVLNRRLRPVPRGGEGELYVCGPSLAIGIVGRPAATASRFVASIDRGGERMYRTGDRVRRGTDDQIWFIGRVDDQVKILGVRIELAEIDRAVLETGIVSASATIAHETERGRRLHTYVVAAGTRDDIARRVRDDVRTRLGTAYTPAGVTVVDELPLTVNNKLDRARLPAPTAAPRREHRRPTDTSQRAAVDAFEHALGVSAIGLDDDFFDMGGDSLAATTLVARIAAVHRVRIGVREVFTHPTPGELAELVRSTGRVVPDVAVHLDTGGATVPLAPSQRNVYPARDRIDHLIAFAVTVPSPIPVSVVRRGVAALLDTHPMLRSRFDDNATFAVDPVSDPVCWTVDELGGCDREGLQTYLHRPIDVAHRYPLRIGVGTASDQSTVIAVCLHHLAADGESLRIILAGLLGAPVAASDAAEYREYALSQQTSALEHRAADIEHAARSAVSADLAPRRPAVWDRRGARVRVPLGRPAWGEVEVVASGARVTVLTVVRAVLARVLARRIGTDTVPIGALLSGRDDARWANVVGMFVNTVSVPCRVRPTVAETIVEVRRAEDAAFAHATTAFADVVEALGPVPTDRHPLFQVMLTMDDHPAADWDGVQVTPVPVDIAHCDLHVSVIAPRGDDSGAVEVLYAVALFDDHEVRDLVAELTADLAVLKLTQS